MRRAARIAGVLTTAALAFAHVSCGDNPFEPRWDANPDTVLLYSLDRPEINLASGFDFVSRRPVEIQDPGATGSWDLVVDRQGGDLVFLPPGALGIDSEAGIARLEGRTFEDVTEAPSDTAAYRTDEGVAVEVGSVYVVRTRLARGNFRFCNFFAKLEPLSVSREQGSVVFVFDSNPVCDDRRLVPPDD